MSEHGIGSNDGPVTLRVARRVKPGRERELEDLARGLIVEAEEFPGCLSATLVRPPRGEDEYAVVFRFASPEALRGWEESEERAGWYERLESVATPPRREDLTGTLQESPLVLLRLPFEQFVRGSVSGTGLLLLGTVAALIVANSPLGGEYRAFWDAHLVVGVPGVLTIDESLLHWVNDGLMAFFFFLVGLEIKREVLVGELRSPKQAALPIAAALGGMVVPALLYIVLNGGGAGGRGWGIPMATDIAFALGVLTVLGKRVPPLLTVFLTALAIVDDLGAVLVIAVFYTADLNLAALGVAAALLAALLLANRLGFHRWPIYAFLGAGVWLAVFESGIHATLAGVLVAMTVPARSWINPIAYLERGRVLLDTFERAGYAAPTMLSNEPQQAALQELDHATVQVQTPLAQFEHALTPWVGYLIIPVFAFANAGVPLPGDPRAALENPVTLGVILGLVVGKPIGITFFAWLAVRLRIAVLPPALRWAHIYGVGWLAGIGFTIALFITELAFVRPALADAARVGILVASLVAGVGGFLILRAVLPQTEQEAEAEREPVTAG